MENNKRNEDSGWFDGLLQQPQVAVVDFTITIGVAGSDGSNLANETALVAIGISIVVVGVLTCGGDDLLGN